MSFVKESVFDVKCRLKLHQLAGCCGWLAQVLRHQDGLLGQLDALSHSPGGSGRPRWAGFESALVRHLRVEELVLAPAIRAMGQRAHAVVADRGREQIRRGLETVCRPAREDDGVRLDELRFNIASHFAQEESWSHLALARYQDAQASAALAAQCLALLDVVEAAPAYASRERKEQA